jgi:hypothetical protein
MNSPTGDVSRHPKTPINDPYDALPEAIRYGWSRAEWTWLSDAEKANLIQQECDPEW